MKLISIDIKNLPGIEPGFKLENLSLGNNFIVGPNAVGKSSLVRALKYLITTPQSNDPKLLSLSAIFEAGQNQWAVRRLGRDIIWEKDGNPSEPPALPNAEQLLCYWLSIEELLETGQEDEQLLIELRKALSGGYDLETIQSQAPFTLLPRHGHTQAKALREARKNMREIEVKYDDLRQEEHELSKLQIKIDQSQDAQTQTNLLQKALTLLEARKERKVAEDCLAEFPANMEKLHGHELERLNSLDNKRIELRLELQSLFNLLKDANSNLLKTKMSERLPKLEVLRTREKDLEEARIKNQSLLAEREKLNKVAAQELHALSNLGGGKLPPKLEPISISEAEQFATQLQNITFRYQELKSQVDDTIESPKPQEIERFKEASLSLSTWLTELYRKNETICWSIYISIAGGLMATAIARIEQAWTVVAFGTITTIAAISTLIRMRVDKKPIFQAQFLKTGLKEPDSWDEPTVTKLLDAIDSQLATLREQQVRAIQKGEIQKQLARVQAKLQQLQNKKKVLSETLGFNPSLSVSALDRFIRLVETYEVAHAERLAIEKRIERLEDAINEQTNRLQAFLTQWQLSIPEGELLNVLQSTLDELKSRFTRAQKHIREMERLKEDQNRINKHLDEIKLQEEVLLEKAGFNANERELLEASCNSFENWKKHYQQVRDAISKENLYRQSLEKEEELLRQVEKEDYIGLKRKLEHTSEKALQFIALKEKVAAIQRSLQDAGHDLKLEQAQAALDVTQTKMEDAYNEALYTQAADFLLEGVKDEYHNKHQPEVLRDAGERFSRFTHHAFDLEIDGKHGFMAFNRVQGKRQTLNQLSSGTRMQLLLAMRIAWTRQIEKGCNSLPLFLDEALTTSDEQRFSTVVDSLNQLVDNEGRQIFYLSARRNEIALWERVSGSKTNVIDLAAIRFSISESTPQDYTISDLATIPAPGNKTSQEYASVLGILPVDPRKSVKQIHLFYLLRDNLSQLHYLMETWRIFTLGQLEGLLSSISVRNAISDLAFQETLVGRCATACTWVSIWNQGRGKPIDRSVLDASKAVSAKFIEDVTALVGSLNGDGKLLINALKNKEVAGFRQNKIDALEEILIDEGYIDSMDTLSSAERERHTLMLVAQKATPEDARKIVHWLECGVCQERNSASDADGPVKFEIKSIHHSSRLPV